MTARADAASLSAAARSAECIRGLAASAVQTRPRHPPPRRSGRASIRRPGRNVRVGEEVARRLEHDLGCRSRERDLPHTTVGEHDAGPPHRPPLPVLPSSSTGDSHNRLCPTSAGPNRIPWWAYCGQYVPGQVSDLFIFVFYGYSVDTYPRRIGYVSTAYRKRCGYLSSIYLSRLEKER
jgi:hypothetical protein